MHPRKGTVLALPVPSSLYPQQEQSLVHKGASETGKAMGYSAFTSREQGSSWCGALSPSYPTSQLLGDCANGTKRAYNKGCQVVMGWGVWNIARNG